MDELSAIFKIIRLLFKPLLWLIKTFGLHIIFIGYMAFSMVAFTIAWWGGYYKITVSLYNTLNITAIIIIGGITLFFWLRYMIKQIMRSKTKNPAWTFKDRKEKNNIINPEIVLGLKTIFPEGFIFGKKDKYYIAKNESFDGHILVVGGAGSGKSSCIAIPSILCWRERIFAIDIKGELEQKTRGKRFIGERKIFNPSSESSYGFDPFYILSESQNIVQDIKEIALAIIPLPHDVKEPYWIKSAQNLFTGAMIYYYVQGKTFIETIFCIQSTPVQELITEISESDNYTAKLFTNQFIGMDSKTISSIFTEISNNIMLFATDNQIKQALSKKNNITPKDLENGIDIFVCIEESRLEQWKSLLTLIVNQFLKHFERRPEDGAEPILFLLDEFARLGKIESTINGLATLRSKKITIALLIQSLAQLDVIYGKPQRQVIADNCIYKVILKATDADTQEYFSKLVGTYDKEKQSQNQNKDYYAGIGNSKGTTITTEEKRIIKPEDFAYLNDLILLSPFGWYRIDKTPYYNTDFR